MKQKVIAIGIALIGVALGITYSIISADADNLRKYVPLAWAGIGVLTLLLIFFTVATDLRFRFLSLLFFKQNRLLSYRKSLNDARQKTGQNPELENVNADLDLNSWEEIGDDLRIMSWIHIKDAGPQLIELSIVIAPAMLRHGHQSKFIKLGSTAYKRAKRLERWHAAAMIAYYVAHAYFVESADLSINNGHKWVDDMEQMFGKSQNEELRPFLLEIKGLRSSTDPNQENRPIAKQYFETALQLTQQPNFRTKPDMKRLSKNICFYFAQLAEDLRDFDLATQYYTQALDPTSKDAFKQLKIYNKLGQLAISAGDYKKADEWHRKQLDLAREKSSPSEQCSAYKGLANALLEKIPPEIEKAYQHAKEALEIVKERSADNPTKDKSEEENEIVSIIIKISNKMYEEYRALRALQPATLPNVLTP